MSIRTKILLIVIPILIFGLVFIGLISSFTAYVGMKDLAISSFSFKSSQFEKFINNQWLLIKENELQNDEGFINAFEDTIYQFALSLEENTEEEEIFAFNKNELISIFSTSANAEATTKEELTKLLNIIEMTPNQNHGWIPEGFNLAGRSLVGYYFSFEPQNLIVLVAITRAQFYKPIRNIILITIILVATTILISITIILIFSKTLINPLKSMVNSMQNIIDNRSFDTHVDVAFQDEVGMLSITFNMMITELDMAYNKIKEYAFSAILAKRNERKIRSIFQKYVPNDVINNLFQDTTRLLVGEDRKLTLLFTDIRSFTTISETYTPDKLVQVLNVYFEKLVDIIASYQGVVDKYIGDAIMAFFGAPMELENSPLNAVSSSLKMIETLDAFNADLKAKNLPQFVTGIGINYGLVTVGNIGSDKKMDYTAIGDAVNLGSRLEGLTKGYKQDVIFSTSVKEAVEHSIPCRVVDVVQVKGKTTGETIYTSTPYMTKALEKVFHIHNKAHTLYTAQKFRKAEQYFKEIQQINSSDYLSQMYIDRIAEYKINPPGDDWDGTLIMTTK